MALIDTPICNFGEEIHDFFLQSVDDKKYHLKDLTGEKGTLVMFICNHCPYVKAIIKELSETAKEIEKYNIKSIAIMPNDTINYPDDNLRNMKLFAKENNFTFPYLIDETQEIAKRYGAVCTPDFFGYNAKSQLQYRGRLRPLQNLMPTPDGHNELQNAMIQIAETQNGPQKQHPSMGCSIKWK